MPTTKFEEPNKEFISIQGWILPDVRFRSYEDRYSEYLKHTCKF